MKAEIVTSFERDKKQYLLLEIEQEQRVSVEDGFFKGEIVGLTYIRIPKIEDFKF